MVVYVWLSCCSLDPFILSSIISVLLPLVILMTPLDTPWDSLEQVDTSFVLSMLAPLVFLSILVVP